MVFALLIVDTAGTLWTGIGLGMYGAALALFLSAIEAARRAPMTRTFVYEPRCDRILSAPRHRDFHDRLLFRVGRGRRTPAGGRPARW